MPLYTIAPSSRRNMHYNPFSPVLFSGHGGHSYGPRRSSPCAPPRTSASLVPSLFKDLESDFSSSLDSFFNDILSSPHQQAPAIRSFQPRFDVREEADAFHLTGDLPGVEAGNIAVEFTDRDTMVVKGQTVRETRQGNAPAATTAENEKAVEGTNAAEATTNPAAATTTEADAMETDPTTATPPSRTATPDSTASNYHKATVEDDADDFVDVAAENKNGENTTAAATATADSTSASNTQAAAASSTENTTAQQQQQQQVQQPPKPTTSTTEGERSHYWVSERSIGSFSRTFRFPAGSADRDNVSASLKDGVLKVVVPKNKEQGLRRIRVE